MLKSLFTLFTVACADADLHLLQMSAGRQSAMQDPGYDEDLENDEPVVDGPELSDAELDNDEDGSPDDSPLVDDPNLLQVDQMVLEDHLALDLDFEEEGEDAADQLPPMNAHGVYPDQRPKLKRGDIRGYLPNIPSMAKCQCEGEKRKAIGTKSVLYHRGVKRCLFLTASVNPNDRMSHRGWSFSQKLVCVKTMKWWPVPSSCNGLRGFDHAKCTKLRAAAGYTSGTWRNKKKCYTTVSTNPKMYDWDQAKDYCLKGNSYCNGIAKLTVRKNGKYVNEYTFCKDFQGRFVVGNLPRTWPYGGVLEVRRQPRVEMPDDAFDKYR